MIANQNKIIQQPKSLQQRLSAHWPEYLIEAVLFCIFMICVGLVIAFVSSPRSPLYPLIPGNAVRNLIIALTVGITIMLLIQSRWGKRSGAHMNPAITLAFLRLGRIQPWDAVFYMLAQTIGATLGIVIVALLTGDLFSQPPIHYAVTVPGPAGAAIAFLAETVISFILMITVLIFVASSRLSPYTALAVGILIAFFIMIEAPLSGTSMNPARTLASAFPSLMWDHLWIYLIGPPIGMVLAAQTFFILQPVLQRSIQSSTLSSIQGSVQRSAGCAKLLHTPDVRCIHCGYDPEKATNPNLPA